MEEEGQLPIGGFHKYTLIDYPGHISAVVFTLGCNMRCTYCHNKELLNPRLFQGEHIGEPEVLDYLDRNKDLLDAVVVTGGEPTLHRELPAFLQKVRALDLKIKLDTNGTRPEVLEFLLEEEWVDYVAMDLKAPLKINRYRDVAGEKLQKEDLGRIRRSMDLLSHGRVGYEFRTTLALQLDLEDLKEIVQIAHGKLYFQKLQFSPQAVQFKEPVSREELEQLCRDHRGEVELALRGFGD